MTITKLTPSVYDTGNGMVANIIEEACQQAGIPASRLDTSLLGYAITGVVYTGETYAERVDALLQAFKVNAIDTGDRLAFVPRTAETTVAVAEDDLGARLQGGDEEGGGAGGLITIVKAPDSAAPRQVSVSHVSRSRDYQASAQVSKRQSTKSVRHEEVNLTVGLDDQQAQWLADAELRERALEGTRVELALPPRYLRITEGDVRTVPYRGRTFAVRVFELQWDGVVDERVVFFSSAGRIHRHALPQPGAESLFKALPPLYDLSEIGSVPFANTGAGLNPFSVCHVARTPDSPSAGDLTLTWVRRTRQLHDWTDYGDAPLGEASEAYEVDVLAAPGGAGATVLATYTAATPELTLTAAQLSAAYGGAPATVYLAIT